MKNSIFIFINSTYHYNFLNFTKFLLDGLAKITYTSITNLTSVLTNSYFFNISRKNNFISIIAICCPKQFLSPVKKGINAKLFYNALLNLSGLNSSGLSKYSGFLIFNPIPVVIRSFFFIE
jgi:hypothetical protein